MLYNKKCELPLFCGYRLGLSGTDFDSDRNRTLAKEVGTMINITCYLTPLHGPVLVPTCLGCDCRIVQDIREVTDKIVSVYNVNKAIKQYINVV